MYKIKRLGVKGLLVLIMVFALIANTQVVQAADINDVDSSADYAKASILSLAQRGIISGDENGNFKPKATIKRPEMIKLVVGALELDTENIPDTPTFKDVPMSHWAYKYVEAAYRDGIVKGISQDTFGISEESTREQMAAMFVRALGINVDEQDMDYTMINNLDDREEISSWAKNSVEFALKTGLMNGTSQVTFGPKGDAKREQVAVLTDRFIGNKDNIIENHNTEDQSDEDTNEDADETESHQHEALYDAITERAMTQYTGQMAMNTTINMTDVNTGEVLTISTAGDITINGEDIHTKSEVTVTIPELGEQREIVEQIKKGNTYYMFDSASQVWYELTDEIFGDLQEAGAIDDEFNNMQSSLGYEALLEGYEQYTISNEGAVDVEGVQATKYVFDFSKEDIESLVSETMELMTGDTLENPYENIGYSVEVYVDGNNQIIKETSYFTGTIKEGTEEMLMEMTMEVIYKNIGQEIEIQAPENTEEFNMDLMY